MPSSRLWILFIVAGRSGTKYITTVLKDIGLDISHDGCEERCAKRLRRKGIDATFIHLLKDGAISASETMDLGTRG